MATMFNLVSNFIVQVNQVPWPFTSKEQFDKTHSAPLGRHWNTETTFQSSIKPRVTTAVGKCFKVSCNFCLPGFLHNLQLIRSKQGLESFSVETVWWLWW